MRVEERIRLGGAMIAPAELEALLARLEPFPELTFFETLTAAALLAFAERRVGVAVLEAGMGGRWDATRVAGSALAGLTNVGTDHRRWLGDDREAIAGDKGCALAAAELALYGAGLDPELVPALGAPEALPASGRATAEPTGDGRLRLRWRGGGVDGVRPPLPGDHQRHNVELALALAAAAAERGWTGRLDPDRVRAAVETAAWPGRLTVHRVAGRRVLLDGAHNLEAAAALARHLRTVDLRPHLLFSCLEDKPVEAMAAVLAPVVGEVVVCQLDDERAMPLERLRAAFVGSGVARRPLDGLERLPDPVLAAGSLRLVGELLAEEGP